MLILIILSWERVNNLERTLIKYKRYNLIRDGCDVVPSYLKMGRYNNMHEAAFLWKASVQAGIRFKMKHPNYLLMSDVLSLRACLKFRKSFNLFIDVKIPSNAV